MEIGERLCDRWLNAGDKADGVELASNGRIEITRSGARLEKLPLIPGEFDALHLRFIPAGRRNPVARVFALDAAQFDEKNLIVGGQRFYLKIGPRPPEYDWDHEVGLFDGVSSKRNAKRCGGYR